MKAFGHWMIIRYCERPFWINNVRLFILMVCLVISVRYFPNEIFTIIIGKSEIDFIFFLFFGYKIDCLTIWTFYKCEKKGTMNPRDLNGRMQRKKNHCHQNMNLDKMRWLIFCWIWKVARRSFNIFYSNQIYRTWLMVGDCNRFVTI